MNKSIILLVCGDVPSWVTYECFVDSLVNLRQYNILTVKEIVSYSCDMGVMTFLDRLVEEYGIVHTKKVTDWGKGRYSGVSQGKKVIDSYFDERDCFYAVFLSANSKPDRFKTIKDYMKKQFGHFQGAYRYESVVNDKDLYFQVDIVYPRIKII